MPRYDPLNKADRSERMSRIRSGHTNPELVVRRLVYGMGYRYRLHAKDLPGKPDLVFRSLGRIIFVHGCFWHQHGCGYYRMPKTRQAFWTPKLDSNRLRDVRHQRALKKRGWKVMTLWECELKGVERLKKRIRKFLHA